MKSILRQFVFSCNPNPLFIINRNLVIVFKNKKKSQLRELPFVKEPVRVGKSTVFQTFDISNQELHKLLGFVKKGSQAACDSLALDFVELGYYLKVYPASRNEFALEFVKLENNLHLYKKYFYLQEKPLQDQSAIQAKKSLDDTMRLFMNFVSSLVSVSEKEELYFAVDSMLSTFWNHNSIDILVKSKGGFTVVYSKNTITGDNYRVEEASVKSLLEQLYEKKSPFLIDSNESCYSIMENELFTRMKGCETLIILPVFKREMLSAIIILGLQNKRVVGQKELELAQGLCSVASIMNDNINTKSKHDEMKQNLMRHEKLTALGSIVAGVAHEINNPLSIMQLDINELEKGTGEEISSITTSLKEEVDRIKNLLKQLRDYVSPDINHSGGLSPLNIIELFKSYPLKIMLKSLRKGGIDITINSQLKKASVSFPKNSMIQVLMNLITNARDALAENFGEKSISITIESSTRLVDEMQVIKIAIADNGSGIISSHLERVFDPFFTTKQAEGTGLGLSICYAIVTHNGGDIYIHSKETEGTEVVLELPALSE